MTTDFASWEKESLVNFAVAANAAVLSCLGQEARLLEQEALIRELRVNLRVAMDAYRSLVVGQAIESGF